MYIMPFKYFEAKETSVSFTAYPTTAALSYRKSAGTSLDSWSVQESDKRESGERGDHKFL